MWENVAGKPALSPLSLRKAEREARRGSPAALRSDPLTLTSGKIYIRVIYCAFRFRKSAEAISLSSRRKHFLWLEEKRSGVPSSRHRGRRVYCGLRIHQRGLTGTGISFLRYKFK